MWDVLHFFRIFCSFGLLGSSRPRLVSPPPRAPSFLCSGTFFERWVEVVLKGRGFRKSSGSVLSRRLQLFAPLSASTRGHVLQMRCFGGKFPHVNCWRSLRRGGELEGAPYVYMPPLCPSAYAEQVYMSLYLRR